MSAKPVSSATNTKQRRRAVFIVGVLAVVGLCAHFGLAAARTHGVAQLNDPAPDPVSGRVADGGGSVQFTAQVDRSAVLEGGDGQVRVELVMSADGGETKGVQTRTATDIVVVLDRSGSMSGSKLADARRAVANLVEQLTPRDRFSLVTYESSAEIAIPFGHATQDQKRDWLRRIDRLKTGGGTNMSAGLDVAQNELDRLRRNARSSGAQRVLLISDGHANEGDASMAGLERRAARAMQHEGVLSSIGVGEGFNEVLMARLADQGTGNYYYLEQGSSLAEIFHQELASSRETLASALEVTIEPAAGVTVEDAAGYPLERADGRVTFRTGSLFAGQKRRVWLTLHVPTHGADEHALGGLTLAFTKSGKRQHITLDALPEIAMAKSQETFLAGLDKDAWERGVVTESLNRMQQNVAKAVREGRHEAAMDEISAYESRYGAMNSSVASPRVRDSLEEAKKMKREVNSVFAAPAAERAAEQNSFSKKGQAAAIKQRRAGSYRE